MKILEKEFEIDFFDADLMEKIELGMELVEKKIKDENIKKSKKASVVIREICKVIFDFFDRVLGEGSSKKIFENKASLTKCVKAYEEFIDEKVKQEKSLEEVSKKYSPNRATRRAKK